MEPERFDALVRVIDRRAPRRAALGVLLATLLSRRGMDDADAKRKRHKKKKRKACKSGTKKCGVACVPAANCCPTCSGGHVCVNGGCSCPAGLHDCGEHCVTGEQCCNDGECGGANHVCDDGSCVCPDPVSFPCITPCCGDEVCAVNVVEGGESCQAGGCPTTDWCADEHLYVCGDTDCSCVTSVDDTSVCTHVVVGECVECTSDNACTASLGQPALCIPNGPFCADYCDPEHFPAFCMVFECTGGAPLSHKRAASSARMNKQKVKR